VRLTGCRRSPIYDRAMTVADVILQPYIDAPTLLDAERALDRLAGHGDELPVPIGDLYDELAEAAANDDEYEMAARLEAKALAAGCRQRFVASEMLGWYLLKCGATEDGEAVFRELLAERPDDADVRITLGHARSDAGLQDAALEALDDALAAAKRRGFSKEIERARVERRAEASTSGWNSTRTIASPPRPDLRGQGRLHGRWRGFRRTSTQSRSSTGPTWPRISPTQCATRGASRSICGPSMPLSGIGRPSDRSSWTTSSRGPPRRATTPPAVTPAASTPRSSTGRAGRSHGRPDATTHAGADRDASTSVAAATAEIDHHVAVIRGSIPDRALRLVREWLELRREEVEANWRLAATPASLNAIDPLP
jgi:Domain of unknown function (DUF4160)